LIVTFNNIYLQKIFENKPVIGKPQYASDIIQRFKKTVLMLQLADDIRELRKYKGLNFEALKGNMKGYYSVRVDKQYRLILQIKEDKSVTISEILVIEDLSKHYE
jgi:proteic killer suppression protein